MGHGDHWGCIDEDHAEVISRLLPLTCERGKLDAEVNIKPFHLEEEQIDVEVFATITYPETDLRSMIILGCDKAHKKNLLLSGYPMGWAGIEHEVEITAIHDWENYMEGQIEGIVGNASSIIFFDTRYFKNREKYKLGEKHTFFLSAVTYNAEKVPKDAKITVNNPEVVRTLRRMEDVGAVAEQTVDIYLAGAAILLPYEKGERDDYVFQATAKDVKEFYLDEYRIFRMRMALKRPDDNDFDVYVYASENSLTKNYTPESGDDITGGLWLQGYLKE